LIFNILAVCGTCIFTGVLLTIGLTLGSHWKSLPPAEFLDGFAKNLRFIGRTLPVCLTAMLLGLVGSLWLGWSNPEQRYLWGVALVCIVGHLVITSIYNGPMNSQFASKSIPPDRVAAALNTWLTFHAVRTMLGLVASVIAVLAVTRYTC
jgi:uncharacterized membrane protein